MQSHGFSADLFLCQIIAISYSVAWPLRLNEIWSPKTIQGCITSYQQDGQGG